MVFAAGHVLLPWVIGCIGSSPLDYIPAAGSLAVWS